VAGLANVCRCVHGAAVEDAPLVTPVLPHQRRGYPPKRWGRTPLVAVRKHG
jgi:hypothetical protein